MLSAKEYFSELYREMPKPILVYDAEGQLLFSTSSVGALLARVGQESESALPTYAVRQEAQRCIGEQRAAAVPVEAGEEQLLLFMTPVSYEGRPYLILEPQLPARDPERAAELRILRNARGKLSGHLNAIYGVAQKLGLDSPEGKILSSETRRILRMVNHLYQLLDREGTTEYRTKVDVGRFVSSFLRNLSDIHPGLAVITAPFEQDLTAEMMPEDMELILGTLISNAFRFGGKTVWVRTYRSGDRIYITVCDDGPGVAAPDRLFEWGYRTADARGVKGLGFGLAMARELANRQGAALLYEREEGQTLFHIVLKAAELLPGMKLADWQPESLENSLSQMRIEMSDYIKEMEE